MNKFRIIFTLTVVLFIGFGLGCTSKKSEEKKESAQTSTQTGQAPAQPSQKNETQQPSQTSSTQPTPAQQLATQNAELQKKALTKCEQTFESLDANKDGLVTNAELADSRYARLINKDKNGDGALTRDELCTFGQKRKPGEKPRDWRELLKPQEQKQ